MEVCKNVVKIKSIVVASPQTLDELVTVLRNLK